MAHLQILGKVKGLRHADVAVVLEHHHGQGTAREHVSNDELGQNIKAKLNIGDGLDKPNGDEPDDGKQHADNVGPPREPCWPACHNAEGDGHHNDEES